MTDERVLGVHGALSVPLEPDLIVVDEAATDDGFTAFYRGHRDRLARALALTLRDGHLAAEAVDEAMARAFQRWDRVASFTDPPAWVYRVAFNWATSVIRRRLRPQRAQHAVEIDDASAVGEPSVLAALAELDVNHRAVIVCRYYLGLSEAETAAALRTRPGTVKSRLHRGLRILEARLSHLRPEGPA